METAVRWIRAMTQRGVFSHNTGRMRATALEQLALVLEEHESREAQAVLDMLPTLVDRWAAEFMRKPETAASYQRRARAALTDFLAFRESPGSFKPSLVRSAPRKPRKKRLRPKEEEAGLRDCPLGDGRTFRFEVPAGWCMADVNRIVDHLATLAHDYRSPR